MNATIESLFGPSSEPIDIPAFIQTATAIPIDEDNTDENLSVADECDVSDIRDDLTKTWNNPRLSAHLSMNHDQLLMTLNPATKSARNKRKAQLQDPLDLPPDVIVLQDHLGGIKLSCWKYVICWSQETVSSQLQDSHQIRPRLFVIPEFLIKMSLHKWCA